MRLRPRLTQIARWLFVRTPLVGKLANVPREALQDAYHETLTTIVFATMPFWILPSLGHFLFTPKPAFDDGLRHGEGLIYAAVLLGPLFFVLTRRYGRWTLRRNALRHGASPLTVSFPYGTAFVAITALTCVVSGFAFALSRQGHGAIDIDEAGTITLSWFLIVASTFVFFLITAYSNMLDDLAANKAESIIEEQPRSESAFVDDWLESKQ